MSVEFETLVFTIIGSIPKGKVATYGQIADMAGKPNYARKVGFTLKSLPSNTKLPWYRVINSQGKISFACNCRSFTRNWYKNACSSNGSGFGYVWCRWCTA